jgi:pimeloyl-ACP methyl ester carboxylesterase
VPDAVLAPPPKWLFAAELPRAALTVAQLAAAMPALRKAPRGDGRPILLVPGLATSDLSNLVIRRFLNGLGYRARGWGLGANLGNRTLGPGAARLEEVVRRAHAEAGEPLTLIGVSLGGIMVRLAAHRYPDLVREVITISAPFAGDARGTNVWRAFQWLSGEKINDPAVEELRALAASPPPVPTTAIWSATDGFVNPGLCRSPSCRSIEVSGSHLGVQFRPAVLLAVARVLAGAEAK